MASKKALNAVLGAPLDQGALSYLAQTQARNATPKDVAIPEVTQAQADARDKTAPAFWSEVIPAAFNESNITVGLIDHLSQRHTIDLNYNKDESLKEITKGIPDKYLNDFTGMSEEEDRRILSEVHHKMAADETIARTSGITALGAQGMAMLLDPIGIAMFGTEAKLLNGVLTKGKRAVNALYHAGASAGTMEAYEYGLHEVHGQTMDAQDVLYAGLGGALFGGVLGAASKGSLEMQKRLLDAGKRAQAGLDEALVREGTNGAQHVPMTREEALARAMEEPLPEFPQYPLLNKKQQQARLDLHLNTKADATLEKNALHIAEMNKPKPVTHIPEEINTDLPDKSVGMFQQAREAINNAWENAAKNDGSTIGMGIAVDTTERKRLATHISSNTESVAKGFVYREGRGVSLARRGSEEMSSPTLAEPKGTPGRLYVSVSGKGLDYNKAADKAIIEGIELTQEAEIAAGTRQQYNVVDELRKLGYTHVDNWSSIGKANELHVVDTAASKIEHIEPLERDKFGRILRQEPDTSILQRIKDSWNSATKNDGSRLGFGPVFENDVAQIAKTASERYTQEADKLAATGVFDALNKGIGKLQTSLGIAAASDSSYMLSSKANEAKKFVYDFLENGTGIMHNSGNAALKKIVNVTKLMTHTKGEWDRFSMEWRKANGKTSWKHSLWDNSWADDAFKELRTEMEMRSNAHEGGYLHESPFAEYTQRMADKLDNGNYSALNMMVKSGVYGAADIVKKSGYTMLLWNGRAIRQLHQTKGLYEKFETAMAESYVKATGMPLSDAQKVTKAVLLRAKNNDLGIDSNPHALLSRDSREFLRETLKNSESMSEVEMEGLFQRIDASMADKGMNARVKRRTNIDLLAGFEHEGKQHQILDLVDNDMQMMNRRYMEEISGRSAMAEKGIAHEADWTAQRQAILEGMNRAGDDISVINEAKNIMASTYNQLLGRPVGTGVNRTVRRMMDMTSNSLLAAAGLPQIAEMAQIMGEHGISNMFNILPTVKAFRTAIKNGTVDKTLLGELSPWTGAIWDEHILFSAKLRIEDAMGSDPAWLKRLDRTTANIKDFMGYASGMYGIKQLEQQMCVALQANKMAQMIKGMTISEGGIKLTGQYAGQLERLKSVGWDEKFLREMKNMEQHFEFDASGVLQRLNIQKWNNSIITDQFVEGLHKHTHRLIQKPLVGESRTWMHSTVGSMLTQFRNYPLVGIEKQSMHQIHMGDSNAVWTAMYGLGMSGMVSLVKTGLAASTKNDKDRKTYLDKHLSPSGLFKGALAYSSITSVLQDGMNFMHAMGLAPEALASTQNTRNGGSRGVDISMKDIPAMGFAINSANAVGGLIKNTIDPSYKYSKKDKQAMKGIIPLSTMPGFSQMLDVMGNEMIE